MQPQPLSCKKLTESTVVCHFLATDMPVILGPDALLDVRRWQYFFLSERNGQMLLKSKMVQRLAGGFLERWGTNRVCGLQRLFLGTHKDRKIIKLMKRVRKEVGGPMTNEAFILMSLANSQSQLPGDFAEVGVFRGGSARFLCEAKGDTTLRLFDTYAGLPEGSEIDGKVFRKSQYACSQPAVANYLKDYKNLHYYEGLFPDSTEGVEEVCEAKYALAHFDVDLYEGTLACLDFFYPRMVAGGVMITHDYSILAGVKKAFDEFFAEKPEGLIEMPTTQCMVIKLSDEDSQSS